MNVDFEALQRNQSWKLVKLPRGNKPIGCKWIFQKKDMDAGSFNKARLVVKEHAQKEGVDFEDTISATTKMIAIKLVLALATQFGWNLSHMDRV